MKFFVAQIFLKQFSYSLQVRVFVELYIVSECLRTPRQQRLVQQQMEPHALQEK